MAAEGDPLLSVRDLSIRFGGIVALDGVSFIVPQGAIAGLIGPTLFTQTFAAFIGPQADWHLPGAPYLLSTTLLLIGAGIAWRATRTV